MAHHAPKVTPQLEEELRDRLEDTLDRIDEVSDKKRRLTKLLGGHKKMLESTRDLIRRQLKGMDLDQLELPGAELPQPSEDPLVREILRVAGGIVDPAKEKPEDAEQEETPAPKKGEPKPLFWNASGDEQIAKTEDGRYRLALMPGGGWTAHWERAGAKPKIVAIDRELQEARELCRQHHVERAGDALLDNSGDGDLNRRDPKGEASKRKGGHA